MVQKIIPYAYGTYRTRTVCTIRVRYEIRVRYTTPPFFIVVDSSIRNAPGKGVGRGDERALSYPSDKWAMILGRDGRLQKLRPIFSFEIFCIIYVSYHSGSQHNVCVVYVEKHIVNGDTTTVWRVSAKGRMVPWLTINTVCNIKFYVH